MMSVDTVPDWLLYDNVLMRMLMGDVSCDSS